MFSQNELGLSQQEIAEADAFVSAIQSIQKAARSHRTKANDIEEILLTHFGRSRQSVASVFYGLENLSEFMARIMEIWRNTVGKSLSKAMCSAPALNCLAEITKKDEYIGAVATVMFRSAIADAHYAFDAKDFTDARAFFSTSAKTLDNVRDEWFKTVDDVRRRLKEQDDLSSAESCLQNAAKVWAVGSKARQNYLQSKGIYIANNFQFTLPVSMPSAGSKPIRQRIKKAGISLAKTVDQSAEKCWLVSFVNPASGNIEETLNVSFLKDTDKNVLSASLGKRITQRTNVMAAMRQLQRLIDVDPAHRIGLAGMARIFGKNWHKLKVGQHRVLAYIDDNASSMLLMAGRWKKLYNDLKCGRSEA